MKQKLNAKDFILIGILTALMWIICMIISTIMSVAGPVTNVFYPSVMAIPNGIVMMLLLAKVPKKGVFTICAAIQAMRCLKVTDELAASGTTRGLELECKRYALRPIRFAWPEIVVSLLGILFLVGLLFIDQTQIGKIILWRV